MELPRSSNQRLRSRSHVRDLIVIASLIYSAEVDFTEKCTPSSKRIDHCFTNFPIFPMWISTPRGNQLPHKSIPGAQRCHPSMKRSPPQRPQPFHSTPLSHPLPPPPLRPPPPKLKSLYYPAEILSRLWAHSRVTWVCLRRGPGLVLVEECNALGASKSKTNSRLSAAGRVDRRYPPRTYPNPSHVTRPGLTRC